MVAVKKRSFWLGLIIIITLIYGTIYTAAQQVQRTDANSPQIQLSEDIANSLNNGANPTKILSGKVDIRSSLSPFTIIYDKSGQIVSGNGYLNTKLPIVPVGVLSASQGNAYNAITWQPDNGVRIASVSVSADKYYVLSGRSLTEVEKNESNTFHIVVLGWGLSLAVLVFMSKLKKGS
jgi:hypothetical protein